MTINYKAVDSCTTCSGSGLKAGAKKNTCPTCHGAGQTTHVMGGFHMSSTCPSCQGAGVTISKSDECGTCHGHGVQEILNLRLLKFLQVLVMVPESEFLVPVMLNGNQRPLQPVSEW